MKIAIAGYGLEGRANYAYFRNEFPGAEMLIADAGDVKNPPSEAKLRTGRAAFELQDADLVVRTAGLSPKKITTNGKIWSATNEFFAKCPAKIIGVTGTKGKGTTCSLVASILRAAGQTVHLVGNIGVPSLEVLPKIKPSDLVVYELSSFQLWDLEKSPSVAVVLMIEPDHLDVHENFDDYLSAKSNIARYQPGNSVVIYNQNNPHSAAIAELSAGRKVAYPEPLTTRQKTALKLPGQHNEQNASAATKAARAVLPEMTEQQITEGLAGFAGLPHRLKFVAEKKGVRFYDDSISTTPGSAIAAVKAFEAPKVLILGGHDKGADYSTLAQELANSDSLRAVLAVGASGESIAMKLQQAGVSLGKIIIKGKIPMEQVALEASRLAKPGDTVVLSPAAASFDQYASYSDRGDQFVRAVEALPN